MPRLCRKLDVQSMLVFNFFEHPKASIKGIHKLTQKQMFDFMCAFLNECDKYEIIPSWDSRAIDFNTAKKLKRIADGKYSAHMKVYKSPCPLPFHMILVDAESNWWGDATGPYHPTANPGGLGDSVSDYVDFDPWLGGPGVGDQPIVKPVEIHNAIGATIFRGPLQLPKDKKCKVFDITGRVVEPEKIQPGIYFIEVDGVVTQKVVKVR